MYGAPRDEEPCEVPGQMDVFDVLAEIDAEESAPASHTTEAETE